ncbi:1-acyl-sn-glycerol-3-phosphate acyltransferase [Candidatus Woesearchaeota archaeon]|nr:1-acyl-sn-glycerol-3-phosphate acyltransferase [Candidatus Woesearchaeota archaeon]
MLYPEYTGPYHELDHSIERILKRNFTAIEINGLDKIKPLKGKSNLVYCSTHKSHFDYIILGYYFFKNDLLPFRYIAGDNLRNIPYFGKKFEEAGAIFIPRTNNRPAAKKLIRIVNSLVDNEEDFIVFPEARRSYSGLFIDFYPLVIRQAKRRKHSKDMLFVPVSVSYEATPEERNFHRLENKGPLYKINDFGWLIINSFAPLSGKGRAFVDIGEPINADDYDEDSLADKIKEEMGKQIRVFPHNLLARAFIEKGSYKKAGHYLELLRQKGANLKSISGNLDKVIAEGIDNLKRFGILRKGWINVTRLGYYSNNIEHYLR